MDASVGELMRQSRTDVRTFRDCERKEDAESNFQCNDAIREITQVENKRFRSV